MALARYNTRVESGKLDSDPEQVKVLKRLDEITLELKRRASWAQPRRSRLASWFSPTASTVKGVPGLYLWGGVGRGKTLLCDIFFDSLPFDDKLRLHFHRFMQRIHHDLRKLGEVEEPLPLVAERLSGETRLLLLDEIHVNDITDAMLLGRLLTELFKRGVTLVTTSNVPPNGLYKDGLQRAQFLPAIAQIQNHCEVYQMPDGEDYRLRLMQSGATYMVSTSDDRSKNDEGDQQAQLREWFDKLSTTDECQETSLSVNGRDLPVVALAGNVVWLTFEALCGTTRSTDDYIDLASNYSVILISDVPVLDADQDDEARRFVNLIDELYDRKVKVVMSAAAMPDALYTGKRLEFEFVRAASRLTEMQTSDYLGAKVAGFPD